MTVNLSSLDFTRDEIDADLAVVSLGGTALGAPGSTPRTPPTTDEVGKASCHVTPSDAAADGVHRGPTTVASSRCRLRRARPRCLVPSANVTPSPARERDPGRSPTGTVPLHDHDSDRHAFDVPIEIVEGLKTTIAGKASGGKNDGSIVITATVKARGAVATGEVEIYLDGCPPPSDSPGWPRDLPAAGISLPARRRCTVYLGDGAFEASGRR